MKLNILYFAWVRERVGHSQETVETDATTVADLVVELLQRDEGCAAAFADMSVICVAVDQELGELTTHLKDSYEVAFFPPMTGG
jgi:molybdopterin synthase sulfur carrier subunit